MQKKKIARPVTCKQITLSICAIFMMSIMGIWSPNALAQLRHSTPSKISVVQQASTATSFISPTRKPTPSKVALIQTPPAASTQAESPVKEIKPTSELLIPVSYVESTQAPTTLEATLTHQLVVEPQDIEPQEQSLPIQARRPTPSKVRVGTAPLDQRPPLLEASLIPTSSTAVNEALNSEISQSRLNALNAYLHAPSKTPIAALNAQSVRATLTDLQVDAKSVLIIDQDTREVIYSKNSLNVMPIASITKLMTAMVILDAKQNLNQRLSITSADIDTLKNSSSRLFVGAKLTRRELLHLALMSSENRAAHALARNYPGGVQKFVQAMNQKAHALGMTQTTYVDPTGLSNKNRSSARDLVWLVDAAYKYDMIRNWSTTSSHKFSVGKKRLNYLNTNRLTRNHNWTIGLQKTGFINEAGHCLVMQTSFSGRRLIMVFLDSKSSAHRLRDAEKMRTWVRNNPNKHL